MNYRDHRVVKGIPQIDAADVDENDETYTVMKMIITRTMMTKT